MRGILIVALIFALLAVATYSAGAMFGSGLSTGMCLSCLLAAWIIYAESAGPVDSVEEGK